MRPTGTLLAAILGAVILSSAACSSSSSTGSGANEAGTPGGVGATCAINTDCNNPLVCTFQHCHEACAETRDCQAGERCVATTAGLNVCELPSETSCATGACPATLVCGPDQQCRAPCQGGTGCLAGQVCSGGLCYDAAGDAGTTGDSSSD